MRRGAETAGGGVILLLIQRTLVEFLSSVIVMMKSMVHGGFDLYALDKYEVASHANLLLRY